MTGTELILPDGTPVPVRDHRAAPRLELRDPRASTVRQSWTSPTMPQVDEWNAEQAFRYGYAMNVIAYRCVQLRAKAGASVPLVAGRRMGDARTINERARIAQLLGPPPGGPAPKLSASKLIRWTLAQKIVTGRRAWEIETDNAGRPTAFWPLAAAHLRAVPTQSGAEWFRVFHYGPHHDPVKLKPEDVFYGWDPSGIDFRQAESELQASRFDLSLVTLCDRHSMGFLRNNAVPAAIVTTNAFPNDEARRKFVQNWSAEYAGPENAGRVALNELGDDGDGPVSDSIHVEVLGLSAKDARLVEQRTAAVKELAIGLGTPWSKLDASGRTFDNAAQEDLDWWENTILPDLIDLQDDINMQLAPRLGDEVVWFDLRQVRALQRRKFTQISGSDLPDLIDRGVILINEVRTEVDLEPVKWGDAPPEAPAPAAIEPPTPKALPPAEDPPNVPDKDGDDDRSRAHLRAVEALALIAEEGRRRPELEERIAEDPETRKVRIWRASNAVVTALEARWERSWRRLFTRQEEATLSRLTGKRGRQLEARSASDAEQIFTRGYWLNETEELATDLYEETVASGLSRLSMSFGVGFDIASPWAQDFVTDRANQLAGQVTQTTYEQIQRALNEGIASGEGIDDIAARVRDVFNQATTNRAVTIARTEVISAYNGSSVLGANQLPSDVVAGQEWIATRDGRTRSAHSAADGQLVPIGTTFAVGGDQLAYPGDPAGRARNTVQCRCTVAFLDPEEWSERKGTAAPTRPAPVEPAYGRADGSVDVRDTVTYQTKAGEKQFGPTMERLSKIHGAHHDGLAATKIIKGGKADYKGGHFSPAARPPKPRRKAGQTYQERMAAMQEWRNAPLEPEIRINDRGDGTELLSFLHEYGHRIDSQGVSSNGFNLTANWATGTNLPEMVEFLEAAARTETISGAGTRFRDLSYVRYFRDRKEVWARAYSQWAANVLGGPELAALKAQQGRSSGFQWTDEEFETLAPLVENVLRARGLMT